MLDRLGTQLTSDGLRRIDHVRVEAAIAEAQEEVAELRRRRRRSSWLSALGLAAVLARVAVAVHADGWAVALRSLGVEAVTGVALAASAIGLFLARRATTRLQEIHEEIFSLRFLRDALERPDGPTALLSHPYRAPAPAPDAPAPAPQAPSPSASRPVIVTAGLLLGVLAAVAIVGIRPSPSGSSDARRWLFLEDVSHPASLGFQTTLEAAGVWVLEHHEDATGSRALVNRPGGRDESPATAVVHQPAVRDVRAVTRCKIASAHAQEACGLVVRYLDEHNHYVARLDAANGSVVLAVVWNGVERPLRVSAAPIEADRWNELSIGARGDHLVVSCNGETVIEVHDPTLPNPGAVGLWAPAEGMAYFDELSVQPLALAAHSRELLPPLM